MKPNRKALFLTVILICFINLVPAFAGTIQYTYDPLDRLTKAEATEGSMLIITYTYDNVGNRLTTMTQGSKLDSPEVTDAGLFSLDNTVLNLLVSTYGDEYGNLEYEFAIGTSAGAADVVDWTGFDVDPDGSVLLDELDLPFDQEYFVSVRIINFADHVVSETGSSDGIFILDPYADSDQDSADNQSEINAGSNPFNINSYPALISVHLMPGFNLIAIPAEVVYQPDLRNWLPILGDSLEIEKVMIYDNQAGKFITLIPDDTSNPGFMLKGGEGLIVYAKQDKEISFTSVLCSTLDLKIGFNLVGFAYPQTGYTAFQLLNDLGSEKVSSIQRYSIEKGAFETVGFASDGQVAGVDFPIVSGEGYFIFMKQEVLGF